jgi:ubiquinone/menaquinone biosynthesis C-methylase UbiE
MPKPQVVDAAADSRFGALVSQAGRDPNDRWIGGYVDYEWNHGRHVYEAAGELFAGTATLEFGCNYGATCIVLAALGANITGVDINDNVISIARENVARYGMTQLVRLIFCEDTSQLPFADATFHHVVCNSVLEYVDSTKLAEVQREIDRVLKPGGLIFVLSTSNRLSPREVHSRRWLVNYVPESFDPWVFGDQPAQRGVAPWRIRYGFGKYENLDWLDKGRAYIQSRSHFKPPQRGLRLANWISRRFGVTLGLLTPSISVTLRKLRRADLPAD